MAPRTVWRVASETPGAPRTTFDTVDFETPASRATSRIVAGLRSGSTFSSVCIAGNGSLAPGRRIGAVSSDHHPLASFGTAVAARSGPDSGAAILGLALAREARVELAE